MKNPKTSAVCGKPELFRITLICLILSWAAGPLSAMQPSNSEEPRSLYIVEFIDTSQVTIAARSDLRPELNRTFESGDKARWYLTQKELHDIHYEFTERSLAKWYQVDIDHNQEWITLGLKPVKRIEKLVFSDGIGNLKVRVHSQASRFFCAGSARQPPYPPQHDWAPTVEVGLEEPVYVLLDAEDRISQGRSIPLTVELPWGHEFPSGERSETVHVSITPGQAAEIPLVAKRLPLIPLFYIDYSESMPTQKVREMIRVIRTFDDKAVVALGHDGRIVHQTRVSNSGHDNWNRLNQYLNRHPTIGYASLTRNEITQFVRQIQQIQFGFWRNQFAIPILVLSSKYQNSLTQHEFDRWVEQIDKLHQDKLIKNEIIVITLGKHADGEGLVAAEYQTHFFSWSSRELRRELSELLRNLSSGKAL